MIVGHLFYIIRCQIVRIGEEMNTYVVNKIHTLGTEADTKKRLTQNITKRAVWGHTLFLIRDIMYIIQGCIC